MKLKRSLGLITLSVAFLLGNAQCASLKELQEQKKQQEAETKRSAQKPFGKYEVSPENDVTFRSELLKDIPTEKKDLFMKALYFYNMMQPYEIDNVNGHIFDARIMNLNGCRYLPESQRKELEEDMKNPHFANSFYFKGEYGFVDNCIFKVVLEVSEKYSGVIAKKYYSPKFVGLFKQKEYDKKKAFVKWLQDVKFYDYIENLEVVDTNAEILLHNMKRLKTNINIKKLY